MNDGVPVVVVVVAVVVVTGMMSTSDVEAVSAPDVPVTAMIVVPPGAEPDTARVSTEVTLSPAGGVTGLVLKTPVTPDGSVGTDRVTGELKLPIDCTVTMLVPTPPRLMVRVPGLTDRLNEGGVVAVVVVVVVVTVVTSNVAEADFPVLPTTIIV